MTENTQELNTSPVSDQQTSDEINTHHSHSHHNHSHHSHSHHSHSHHKHSHRSGSDSSSHTGKFSLIGFIQRKSVSRSNKQLPQHRVISQRILFCMILLGFVFGVVAGIVTDDPEVSNSGAIHTRSETDLLKTQITILQMEKAALEQELEKYKALYGELTPQ